MVTQNESAAPKACVHLAITTNAEKNVGNVQYYVKLRDVPDRAGTSAAPLTRGRDGGTIHQVDGHSLMEKLR